LKSGYAVHVTCSVMWGYFLGKENSEEGKWTTEDNMNIDLEKCDV